VIERLGLSATMMLEIGAGRGVAVKLLREHGHHCVGVELASVKPLSEVSETVRSATDARTLPAGERNKYRTLLLLDVIEHIEDPAQFLSELRSAFPNSRHVLVTVPAMQGLWSNYDEFYGHYRRYDLKGLESLARQLDARLSYASYFFRWLYLPARVLAVAGIKRGTEIKAPSPAALLLHRLLARLSWADYRLLPTAIPGSSAIACIEW
jgi:2-polyprenyl-3-methyl-5-hydroxy-6-metoxy-1,4-benzoquinol methylase